MHSGRTITSGRFWPASSILDKARWRTPSALERSSASSCRHATVILDIVLLASDSNASGARHLEVLSTWRIASIDKREEPSWRAFGAGNLVKRREELSAALAQLPKVRGLFQKWKAATEYQSVDDEVLGGEVG